MFQENPVTDLNLLRDTAWQGSRCAAAALGSFSGTTLTASNVIASIHTVEEFTALHGDPEGLVAGIHFTLEGDLQGSILAFFQLSDAMMLIEALTGNMPTSLIDLDEMELSALAESGNIVVSSFLSAHESLCGLAVLPSPPTVCIEMCGAVLTSAVLPLVEDGNGILVLEAEITPSDSTIFHSAACRLILLPTQESWGRLQQALVKQ